MTQGLEKTRSGHAVLDLPSRSLKATKIARLLGVAPGAGRKNLLEIGCGSGGISYWFGSSGAMGWNVEAVDVEDVRLVHQGFRFQLVSGVGLPFPDNSFDVVISNHVIEHVGSEEMQREHLKELRRVLRADGVGYLAVPNRWMLVEPHFRLPLLSWLPAPITHWYVRLTGRGRHYDCRPLTCRRAEALMNAAGLAWRQHTGDALRLTFELERPTSSVYRHIVLRIPDSVYAALHAIFPTLIYTLASRGELRT